MPENVLVVGSGGREHALGWKISQSPELGKLFFAPGNGGTTQLGENVLIQATDVDQLAEFADRKKMDMTVVGPETSLAVGISDKFADRGLKVFGPTKSSAILEASKVFAKNFMRANRILTADFSVFTSYEKALTCIRRSFYPLVVKASGLAQGKGVRVCESCAEAELALSDFMVKRVHGTAGDHVLVEKCLAGKEFSSHAFCDGTNFAMFPPSRDYKRRLDGEKGLNTGGMGVYAPAPWADDALMARIGKDIVARTIGSLNKFGSPFTGVIYPGIMLVGGSPYLLEYNVRFGDPETQVYMPLLKTDLLKIAHACVEGRLGEISVEWHSKTAVGVVLVSGGYPGEYKSGFRIHGIERACRIPGVEVFHAGTARVGNDIFTSGGRVLCVTATGDTHDEAVELAYTAVREIYFGDMQYRCDIGR